MAETWSQDSAAEKSLRQSVILGIIKNSEIATQDDLVSEIRRKGIKCTQTTVSRDLSELAVVKVGGHYRLPVEHPEWTPWEREILEHATSVDTAGEVLVVLKTRPGTASPVAVELDRSGWAEVVGTIAGDDTIFLAVRDRSAQKAVTARIRETLDKRIRA
jgi:transcriptional regulator of arginine metabolism